MNIAISIGTLEINVLSEGYSIPAQLWGPPENCHPEEYEPPEWELEGIGKNTTIDTFDEYLHDNDELNNEVINAIEQELAEGY